MRTYRGEVRGRYKIYDAPTENLEQAVLFWKTAATQKGKVAKAAMLKASVVFAVSAVEAELVDAIHARGGCSREEVCDELRKKKYFKTLVRDHVPALDFKANPLQEFECKVRKYRNSVVHTRLRDMRDLAKYGDARGSAEAIRNCLEVMKLLSNAFQHQRPEIVQWWDRICAPVL